MKNKEKNKKNEEKLSKKELIRKEKFEKKEWELAEKGYKRIPLFFDPKSLYIKGTLVILPFAIASILFYVLFNETKILDTYENWQGILLIGLMIILTIIHEAIHGICFYAFVKKKEAIEFGFNVKSLAPYCTCQEPITKIQYIIGAVMPTIILAIIPDIISIITAFEFLHYLSFFMLLGGMGDFLIIAKLLTFKTNGKETIFIDHPYECGLVAYQKEKIC